MINFRKEQILDHIIARNMWVESQVWVCSLCIVNIFSILIFKRSYGSFSWICSSPSPSTTTSQQQLNTLESAENVKNRHDVYHQFYVLVLCQRQQKRLTSKAYETYEWAALIKQIIRCRFPSDIKNYDCYKRPDVVFSVETFIDLFAQ